MKALGAVIFPGFELLELFGPLEIFGMMANEFEIRLLAEKAGPTASGAGPEAVASAWGDAGALDLLLVPGGPGTRREVDNPALLDWLADAAEKTETVMSVCTGSALLAKAGVLDGKRATTNKMAFHWVAEQGPSVDWVKQARWVEDGKVFTSSGVSAGIDMSLQVIATLLGPDRANEVAVWAEYDWHRDASWDPFAEIHGLS